jgi:hypothetical protein
MGFIYLLNLNEKHIHTMRRDPKHAFILGTPELMVANRCVVGDTDIVGETVWEISS